MLFYNFSSYNCHIILKENVMKRLRILSLLPALALTSCSGDNYLGTYQFRLGKTNGSHLEVTATLSDENYNSDGMKKMTLSADLGEEMTPASIIQKYGEQYPILEPFVDIIISEVNDIREIPLYYKVLDSKIDKYGNQLAIGTDFVLQKINDLKEKNEAVKSILDSLEISDSKFVLTPEQTKYFFGAYVNSSSLTFEIPVSMEDLTMQTFWYGKSTRISGDFVDRLPGVKGEERFGTHPKITKDDRGNVTKNECDEVNKTFEKEFSNTHLYVETEDDGEIKIGSFVVETINNKKTLKCYLDSSYSGSHSNIEGCIYTKGMLGDFDVKTSIKLSVNDDNTTSVTYKEVTGKDEAIIDENGNEIRFTDFVQNPFVFRDFHTVNLGLAKI